MAIPCPKSIMAAIEERFLAEGRPRNITSVHPVGLGDKGGKGASHFAHPGLLKRIVCGTYVDSPPVAEMAARNEIEAYTLPQGAISLLIREIAGGQAGPHHPHGPPHLRRSTPGRRPAECTGRPRT